MLRRTFIQLISSLIGAQKIIQEMTVTDTFGYKVFYEMPNGQLKLVRAPGAFTTIQLRGG